MLCTPEQLYHTPHYHMKYVLHLRTLHTALHFTQMYHTAHCHMKYILHLQLLYHPPHCCMKYELHLRTLHTAALHTDVPQCRLPHEVYTAPYNCCTSLHTAAWSMNCTPRQLYHIPHCHINTTKYTSEKTAPQKHCTKLQPAPCLEVLVPGHKSPLPHSTLWHSTLVFDRKTHVSPSVSMCILSRAPERWERWERVPS